MECNHKKTVKYLLPTLILPFMKQKLNSFRLMKTRNTRLFLGLILALFYPVVSVQVRLDVSELGKVRLVQLRQARLKTCVKIGIQKSPCIFCLHLRFFSGVLLSLNLSCRVANCDSLIEYFKVLCYKLRRNSRLQFCFLIDYLVLRAS